MDRPPILCFAYDPFESFAKQIHQAMVRLSSREDFGPVLFVEPERWLSRLARHPRRELATKEARSAWWRALGGGTGRVGERLVVHTPAHRVPFAGRASALRALDRRLLLADLRRIARRYDIRRPIVWVNRPVPPWLLEGVGERRALVFNWTDDWAAFASEGERPEVERRTDELLRAADLVIAVSPGLVERARARNPRTVLVPNGTDLEHFGKALDPRTPTADELRGLPRPVVGFLGFVTPRLDVPVLLSLARARPDWSFVFVGPTRGTGGEERPLFALPNVHALGPRPHASLPAYLKGFDVGIVPYRRNELSDVADAIKIYDYLAAGLPVVATPTAGAQKFPGLVRIAQSAEEFEAAIRDSLATNGPEAVASRRAAVEPHSWDARVDRVAALLRPLGSREGIEEPAEAGAAVP
jgi:glycosyltransferase involved in cell wall biosynthesis